MVISLESGFDFITLYFDRHMEMRNSSKRLFRHCTRFNQKYLQLDIQRKDFIHRPGDIPHFHNGIGANGYHFHILYPSRPTKEAWDELRTVLKHVHVNIQLPDNIQNQEIS